MRGLSWLLTWISLRAGNFSTAKSPAESHQLIFSHSSTIRMHRRKTSEQRTIANWTAAASSIAWHRFVVIAPLAATRWARPINAAFMSSRLGKHFAHPNRSFVSLTALLWSLWARKPHNNTARSNAKNAPTLCVRVRHKNSRWHFNELLTPFDLPLWVVQLLAALFRDLSLIRYFIYFAHEILPSTASRFCLSFSFSRFEFSFSSIHIQRTQAARSFARWFTPRETHCLRSLSCDQDGETIGARQIVKKLLGSRGSFSFLFSGFSLGCTLSWREWWINDFLLKSPAVARKKAKMNYWALETTKSSVQGFRAD